MALKKLGLAGDSFNDVVTNLLQNMNNDDDRTSLESRSRVEPSLLLSNNKLSQKPRKDDRDSEKYSIK
jgi:hypothetical protein